MFCDFWTRRSWKTFYSRYEIKLRVWGFKYFIKNKKKKWIDTKKFFFKYCKWMPRKSCPDSYSKSARNFGVYFCVPDLAIFSLAPNSRFSCCSSESFIGLEVDESSSDEGVESSFADISFVSFFVSESVSTKWRLSPGPVAMAVHPIYPYFFVPFCWN